MKSVNDVMNDLEARVMAYDILFQSLFYSLPDDVKNDTIKTIEQNFSAFEKGTVKDEARLKLEAAKVYAARVSGAKL